MVVYTALKLIKVEEKNVEYCDLIAHLLKNGLQSQKTDQNVIFFGVKTRSDLHPEQGYMRSTDKVILFKDNKGNRYKVTVEANPEPDNVVSIQDKLTESNMKHSRNGDQLGYLMDQLRLKLDYSAQDPSILNEITEEEIEALAYEVKSTKEAKESTNESF